MKRVRWLVLFGVFLLACAAQGQGFRNLGFEAATIVPASGGDPWERVQFAPALPWWTGYVGGEKQSLAIYNDLFLGSAGIGLVSADSLSGVIDGDYTAVLQAGISLATGMSADATLSQVGQVPLDTKSLWFNGFLDFGSFKVSMDGEIVAVQKVSHTGAYSTYAADVQGWAGQSTELSFTAIADDPGGIPTLFYLDSIRFSGDPVPEPSTLALLGTGSAALTLILRRCRK